MTAEEAKKRLEELNLKCMQCQEGFRKDGIEFNPNYCKHCTDTGSEIHKLSVIASPAEKAWDALNWTSSKNEDLYHG